VVANALRNVSSATRNSGNEERRGVLEASRVDESLSASASRTDQDKVVASTTTIKSSSVEEVWVIFTTKNAKPAKSKLFKGAIYYNILH
jgi:hypothetical protein